MLVSLRTLRDRTVTADLPKAQDALTTVITQLETTQTDTLDSKHWMHEDLLTSICSLIPANPSKVWAEDTLCSPFAANWMQPVTLQHGNRQVHGAELLPLNTVSAAFLDSTIHVGYARDHHFFIQYTEDHIRRSTHRLLLNMARYTLDEKIAAPLAPPPAATRVSMEVPLGVRQSPSTPSPLPDHMESITIGNLSVSITGRTLRWLADETCLTPLPTPTDSSDGIFLYQHVELLLNQAPVITIRYGMPLDPSMLPDVPMDAY
jgi:hypothetical protein